MRLTKFSDYSLRILMYLAILPKDQLATIPQLSDIYSISANHVRVVVHNLSKLGYISSKQGKGGGIKLAVSPDTLKIGEVIRAIENDFDIVECFNPKGECSIIRACKLQSILGEALNHFMSHLDNYTLADITSNKKSLIKQLHH